MTTLRSISVRCLNCRKASEHTVLMSTNAFGSADLDLRPAEMHRSTMNTWLQLCPHCGNCAPDIGKQAVAPNILRSSVYQSVFKRSDLPALAKRFYAYALSASNPPIRRSWFDRFRSRPLIANPNPTLAAQAFLHAAWVCDDMRQSAPAIECRQLSAEWFQRLKPFATNEEGLTTGAILVDVLRRSGQFQEAKTECEALLALPHTKGIVRNVLEFQQQLIAQTDTRAYVIADCERSPV